MIPRRFFFLFDLVTLLAAFFLAVTLIPVLQRQVLPGGAFYFAWIQVLSPPRPGENFPGAAHFIWSLFSMVPVTLIVLEVLGGYASLTQQTPRNIIRNSVLAQLASLGLLSATFFVLRTPGYSRLFVFSFLVLSIFGLSAYRLAARSHFEKRRSKGHFRKDVALIGTTPCLERIGEYFGSHIDSREFHLAGYFAVENGQPAPAFSSGHPLPLLGRVEQLADVLVHRAIEYVIAVLPSDNSGWLDQVIRECDYFRINAHIVPNALLERKLQDLQFLHREESFQLPGVTLTAIHLNSDALFFKRVLDVILSSVMLLFLSPLFVLIAISIKVTTPPLPVFYPWRVVGYKGRRFTGYKFTTMHADAEERRADLESRNEMVGPVFKIKDDPRITPLGRLLRKFSLNELPQLWSVFKGDMSLVGPRPVFSKELTGYEIWHKRKLSIRPGITCLWQVRGRNLINNFDDWVRMDLEYIENWSLKLDFLILARTAWVVIRGTGS